MRKTVTITIGGALFHIEEQAFSALDTYLTSIRDHFASYEDASEITSDIEGRIAEEFSEVLKKKRRAAINEDDVSEITSTMGTTKDFAEFEGQEKTERAKRTEKGGKKTPRRLFRDTEDVMIAGVASGIAKYFDLDASLIRIAFLVSLIFGGAGILVYVVLWIVLPEAKTIGEKVEMKGGRLTLERIEATIREKIPEATKKIKPGTFRKVVTFPFVVIRSVIRFIARILNKIVPFLVRVFGFFLILGSFAALLFLTFWFLTLMTGNWEQYMDVPVRVLAGDLVYYTMLISAFILAFIPGVVALGAGLSFLQLKNIFRTPTVVGLATVWSIAFMTGAVTASNAAPEVGPKIESFIEERETEVEKPLDIQAFDSIEVVGSYNVTVERGAAFDGKIFGTKPGVEGMKLQVINGVLTIEREHRNRFCILCLNDNASIVIATPMNVKNVSARVGARIEFKGLELQGGTVFASGGSRISGENIQLRDVTSIESLGGSRVTLMTQNVLPALAMKASGGSHIDFSGPATTLTASAHAGSSIMLRGTGTTLTAEVHSGSSIKAEDFPVKNANVVASSGGRAELHVSDKLTGNVRSGGKVRYKGTPDTSEFDEDISGEFSESESDEDL